MDSTKETLISHFLQSLAEYNRNTSLESLNRTMANARDFFDCVKASEISESEKQLLFFVASSVGVPQYYSMLHDKFGQDTEIADWNIDTLKSSCTNASLVLGDNRTLHKSQKDILDKFSISRTNKYFLSASTSFGKTHLVYEIIKKMQYHNILLIFPTIALLSENYERILSDSYFDDYTVHTLSQMRPDEVLSEHNIFIFTPERYLSFLEANSNIPDMDFIFVDEIYKLDNDFLQDGEQVENERDTAYRLALFFGNLNSNVDVLLCGPYIDIVKDSSFDRFLKDNGIIPLNYNAVDLVTQNKYTPKCQKHSGLIDIVWQIINNNENALVYCSSPASAEAYAKRILHSQLFDHISNNNHADFTIFINHLENTYNSNWSLIQCLKRGIAFHHGQIPKYIQKEVINYFNCGVIKVLFSTTTITEGVNTSAKNMIILHAKKGDKPLKHFDAQNIAGRAGRFLEHYVGNVIILDKKVAKTLESNEANSIRHKNYDKEIDKDPRDLLNVDEKYLTKTDQDSKNKILSLIDMYSLPDYIVKRSQVFSVYDKVDMYRAIVGLSEEAIGALKQFVAKQQQSLRLDAEGFSILIKILNSLNIKNTNLSHLLGQASGQPYSRLYYALLTYLSDGFNGTLLFYHSRQKCPIDEAIRYTSRDIFNTFRYGLVKYLNLFNLIYKHIISERTQEPFENVSGIDRLIFKLEYNASSPEGLVASDYGASQNIIRYFDKEISETQLDEYEKALLAKIKPLI